MDTTNTIIMTAWSETLLPTVNESAQMMSDHLKLKPHFPMASIKKRK